MLRKFACLAALALGLFLIACNLEKKAPAAPTLYAPSEANAKAFAEKFVDSVNHSNVETASAMIDWDIVLARTMEGTTGSPRFRAGFIKGAKSEASLASYVAQLAKTVDAGAKIKFLRVRGDEGGRSALLRVLHPTGGVNYHEMLLTEDKGVVKAADV